MSDLVFKVKGVIGDALMRGDDPANAAIRAMLEHYSVPGNVSYEMCRHAYAHAIAAAMRAELERMG